ncbi:hypothetical protein JL09_g6727 [Pichia kudriavzevii]|uniref:Uncharacterized protein n=1 Tax=Pichia kudriavzevii TaxID=4909 RepID=A0A099NKN3_PICKU|nr:hypothetical protein JL09_g6729 [Pichia kudriavzevii]KGK32666.1 hypothetical protein JL09_g6727 [Pichia kudriavzevii]
MCKGLGNNH